MTNLLDSPPTSHGASEMLHNFSYGAFGDGGRPQSFGYTGRWGGYTDERVGVLNWHRWYGPSVGRWGSRDPIGIEGGYNLYSYADNGSTSNVDWSGLCPYKTPDDCYAEYMDNFLKAFIPNVGNIEDIRSKMAIEKASRLAAERAARLTFPKKSSVYRRFLARIQFLREWGSMFGHLGNVMTAKSIADAYETYLQCVKENPWQG